MEGGVKGGRRDTKEGGKEVRREGKRLRRCILSELEIHSREIEKEREVKREKERKKGKRGRERKLEATGAALWWTKSVG